MSWVAPVPPLANAAGIVFGVLIVPIVLFLLVTRFGLLFPPLGRWIDRRAYKVLPRAGHLFMSDEEVREEELAAEHEGTATVRAEEREPAAPADEDGRSAEHDATATVDAEGEERRSHGNAVAQDAFGERR